MTTTNSCGATMNKIALLNDRLRRMFALGKVVMTAAVAALSAKERDAIEIRARAKSPSRGRGPLAQTMFEIERARITIQRHPDQIVSFEQWTARGR
jgi:hypothetical protein